MKRLSEAEFQVMKAIWTFEPPITSSRVMRHLSGEKSWPIQSVVTLLGRLVEKGFLRSEKKSKERLYYPLVSKEDYLQFETGNFVKQYHDNSFISLLSAFYHDRELSDGDLNDLQEWIRNRRSD
ncbi:BlaI/MecI/CopY family transcriptional regulator [Pelolinea submarina]|uniref:BlaI/MecI/CopY family transcriptional regulator n=1 Tax=Pelolinea submarina TaxID=913107 RepID=UPI000E26F5FD|nr:BlaI/MecI/CopY family transcriptional regulator [Pelolinea submarina]